MGSSMMCATCEFSQEVFCSDCDMGSQSWVHVSTPTDFEGLVSQRLLHCRLDKFGLPSAERIYVFNGARETLEYAPMHVHFQIRCNLLQCEACCVVID